MPPPNKKSSAAEGRIKLEYSLDQDNETNSIVITVNENNEEHSKNVDITYFVDEEGRYYYHSTEVNQEIEEIAKESRLLAEGDDNQTVALVPLTPKSTNVEISYVLIIQDDDKPKTNIGIKVDQVKSLSSAECTKFVRTRFTCPICSYSSHRRYILLRHMRKHSEDRPYACSICERGFKTLASLQNHENMHNGIKPHVCKYCKTSFTTSGEVVRHVRYRHTHEKPHKCTECDYASVELSKLRRHMRCHTGERPYQCPNCTYASQDTFKLKRHLRTHTGEKPYKCETCNTCFTQSNTLKNHKLIHNVVQKPVFPCELCPTKCGRKVDLRTHVQNVHTSITPIKCKKCGDSFPDKYTYKLHSKTHEGEKCFKCELCPYASTTLKYLESHMLKHYDMKPFICDQCDQSFRQKQLLRRHQNLHHNPNYKPKPPKEKTHKCHECRRRFALKGNLIRHLSIHDHDSGQQTIAVKLEN